VAGPNYPASVQWPPNVERIEHLPPGRHRAFYNAQRFALNITRVDMVAAGYSPSVRLFEAAACGTPIISDYWQGLESFFAPGEAILVAHSRREVLHYLLELPETERQKIAARARAVVMANHTAEHRAWELEKYVRNASPLPLKIAT
jgi:spore maturation protein CgeB